VKSGFGKTVRALRLRRGIGLRTFARQLGISATYLSKIERGDFPPPAEDKVVSIADALGEDRDVMLALAGRVASDLAAIIRLHPRELGSFLRSAGLLPPVRIAQLAETARLEVIGGGPSVAEGGPPDAEPGQSAEAR
jgi:transcriptional regulator with XRE-family HTH domain